MLSEPPQISKPVPDFRKRGSSSSQYSQELTEEIYIQQRRQDWFREYALDRGLEPVAWVGSAHVSDNPVTVAERLRDRWGFFTAQNAQEYSESRREIFAFIEDLGVLTSVAGYVNSHTQRSFDTEEFSGFSLFDEYAPLIFVNGKETHSAQIFTIFHEIGHLLLGESGVSNDIGEARSAHRSERWCDDFAAAFLMPVDDVKKLFTGDLGEEIIMSIARRLRVSSLALLNRLRDLRLISFNQWSTVYPEFEERALEVLRDKARKAKEKSGGNFHKTRAFEVGRRFARAVYQDTHSGRTSYADAHRLIGISKVETFNKFVQDLT